MAYKTPNFDAWKRLGITQDVVNAAQDVADTSIGKKAEYWNNCVKFLSELSQRFYKDLSQRQTNWARGIKMDLQQEHGYNFK